MDKPTPPETQTERNYIKLASRLTGLKDHRTTTPARQLVADPVKLSEYQALVGIARAIRQAELAGDAPKSRLIDTDKDGDPRQLRASQLVKHLAPVITGSSAAKCYHVELMKRYLESSQAYLIAANDGALMVPHAEDQGEDGRHIPGPGFLVANQDETGRLPDLTRGPDVRRPQLSPPGPRPQRRPGPRPTH